MECDSRRFRRLSEPEEGNDYYQLRQQVTFLSDGDNAGSDDGNASW